jgi:FkbM family methyltransferase
VTLVRRIARRLRRGGRRPAHAGHALALKQVVTVDSCFGPIEAFEDDVITDQIRRFGNHTRPEFAFATSVLDPDMGVFDLGAHIGTFALAAMARLSPRGRILAVEGSPVTAALATRNLARVAGGAARPAATVLNAFVAAPGPAGAPAGGQAFAIQENRANTGASMLVPRERGPNMAKPTQPFFALDGLVERYFAPGYIKLDTEGTEAGLLMGSAYVAEAKPILYVEINARTMAAFGDTAEDLDAYLKRLGYSFFINNFDRNGRHDLFQVKALPALTGPERMFDVLCVGPAQEVLKDLRRVSRS